jgi:hypothetical protein
MESLDAAVAATKNRSQSVLEKSANSIFTKLTRKNVGSYWNTLLPEYGHMPHRENLDVASWGSLTKTDKTRRGFESMMEDREKDGVPVIMEWAIKNWAYLITPALHWTKQYKTLTVSKTPSLAAFCRHYDKIAFLFDESSCDGPVINTKEQARAATNRAMNDLKDMQELHLELAAQAKTIEELQFAEVQRLREVAYTEESDRTAAYKKQTIEYYKNEPTEKEFRESLNFVVPEWDDVSTG